MTPEEFNESKERVYNNDAVVIKNIEHLYYYNIFKTVFSNSNSNLLNDIPRFTTEYCCIGCGYQLKSADATFCYICGAYPAQKDI